MSDFEAANAEPSPTRAAGLNPPLPLAAVMEHLRDGLVLADARVPGLPLVSVNPAFEELTGYAGSSVLGRNCGFLRGDDHDQPGLPLIRAAIAAAKPLDTVLRNYRRDGSMFLNHLRIAPVLDAAGVLTHFVGLQRDVTEDARLRAHLRGRNLKLRAAVRRLKVVSLTDALTGLANRRAFEGRLTAAWAHASRSHQPLTAFMVDLDWFKPYNDRHGHPAGDAALQSVAAVLRNQMRRGTDVAARHGGEEFALLGHGMPERRACVVAAKLCRHVHRLRLLHEGSPLGRVTISVGHATVRPSADLYPKELMERADAALYHAKQLGRNCASAGARGALLPLSMSA